MQLNKKPASIFTHNGAKAKHINAEQMLRRSVMSCLLWEKEFHESGEDIVTRIRSLIPQVDAGVVAEIAYEARDKMKLRHIPLLLVREMARLKTHRHVVANTLAAVIQRPDELTEFVALYWKDGKRPLSAQVKKGLAKAFTKFNAYSLAKYNRDNAVKLRDVLFLCHAKPTTVEMAETFKQLVDNTLPTPDTWEVALSAGENKKDAWERLLKDNNLGGLALLRNLRNMQQVDVSRTSIKNAIKSMKTDRILPYRFIAAAKYAPDLEPQLEESMFKCIEGAEKLSGRTALLVDVSGSMDWDLSSKSDLKRIDAACGLAMLLREVCEDITVATFSNNLAKVPSRRGFALRDAIVNSQPHGGTLLGAAVNTIPKDFDRVIVITDEQSNDPVGAGRWKNSYMINVASAKNGVGYGSWNHIDGWSEAVVDYIKQLEGTNNDY